MNNVEIWKAIAGTDGKIEVSNYGRIRSLLTKNKTILKTQLDSKGYHRVRVTLNRQKISYRVHREVAKAFLTHDVDKTQVNHIDGNKDHNYVENLEWVTGEENIHHAISTGLFKSVFAGAKLSNSQRKRPIIGTNKVTGETLKFEYIGLAERYFDSRHICDVLKGKRNNVKGWTFEYLEGVIA